MTRVLALSSAPVDVTGTRWAVADTDDARFVSVWWPDGSEAIEVRWEVDGVRLTRRIVRAPSRLHWRPVADRRAAYAEPAKVEPAPPVPQLERAPEVERLTGNRWRLGGRELEIRGTLSERDLQRIARSLVRVHVQAGE